MKLNQISAKDVIKILIKNDFEIVSQKGSHIKLKRQINNQTVVLIVPNHKTLKKGTLLAIIRQSQIDIMEFM